MGDYRAHVPVRVRRLPFRVEPAPTVPEPVYGRAICGCRRRNSAIPISHGRTTIHGFRFGDCAYLTDHSAIPEASLTKLQGLDVLFLDALRHNPHPTHSTVEESLRTVAMLKPQRAFFTHISHDLLHAAVEARLPENVRIAYDGLQIPIGYGDGL